MIGEKVGSNINVVPQTEGPLRVDQPRDVFIGCSAMDINKKLFGAYVDISAKVYKLISLGGQAPPNVTFHWAVIVGDYVHELNYDDHYYNFYENKPFVRSAKKGDKGYYRLYRVGTTKCNDTAIVEDGTLWADLSCNNH